MTLEDEHFAMPASTLLALGAAPLPDAAPVAGALTLALCERALAACTDGVLVADAAGAAFPILYANPALCRMSGHTPAELLAGGADLMLDAVRAQTAGAMIRSAVARRHELRVLVQTRRKDGSLFWNQLLVRPLAAPDGTARHCLCICSDVTELKQHQEQLAFQATHDELTGLPNRSMFNQRLRNAIGHATRSNKGLALLSLSVDNFNLVNESFGHLAGDQFLSAVAQRLLTCVAGHDTVSRHGGKEFLLILGETGTVHEVNVVCERIFACLAPPFPIAGQQLHAACSIGVTMYPRDAADDITLLRYAGMALTRARDQGGNKHRFFEPEMRQRTAERLQMEVALRQALGRDELQMMYQPVAGLQDGAVCALEALVRWRHPDFGLVNASRFIPVAEEAGLIGEIGDWTLRQACQHMRAWDQAGLAPVPVALNLSPKQFLDRALPERIAACLAEFGIAPERLSLELTETVLMQDETTSAHTLGILKALGIGLTLDDFGTGYSSLSHLKRFPLDVVKIDGGLTANLASVPEDAALAKTIISMAHNLGIQVVAEGVETEAQCDFLRRHMCDRIQGYFFGAPAGPDDTAALLAEGRALPAHLLRIQKARRTLLLVDDEQNIVSSLKRLLRRDEYQILTAHSGEGGLDMLARHAVDVIVSDQRMPGMLGADFLRKAKDLYPDTIRIMLSGYTELQSVTDAVNEGAIYKFLTKPWDDDQLRGHIAEAFRLKEIADVNERLNLELRTANHELASTNRRIEDVLRQKQQQITRDEISLNVARELLQFLPLPVLGLDDEGMVAFVNGAAETLFRSHGPLLGNQAAFVLPGLFSDGEAQAGARRIVLGGRDYEVVVHPMGANSASRGSLITFSLSEEAP